MKFSEHSGEWKQKSSYICQLGLSWQLLFRLIDVFRERQQGLNMRMWNPCAAATNHAGSILPHGGANVKALLKKYLLNLVLHQGMVQEARLGFVSDTLNGSEWCGLGVTKGDLGRTKTFLIKASSVPRQMENRAAVEKWAGFLWAVVQAVAQWAPLHSIRLYKTLGH